MVSGDGTVNAVRSGRAVAVRVGLIALLVFALCLLGILTRLPGTLAAFWPANAVLLGIIIRYPRYAVPAAWIVWAAAYMAADLLTGGALVKSAMLNAVNLTGVATGFYLCRWLSERHPRLRQAQPVAFMVSIGVVAACAAGVAGGTAEALLFDSAWSTGLLVWLPTELVHYMTITPLALTCPPFWRRGTAAPSARQIRLAVAALSLLLASLVVAVLIGGSGALSIPVPVLVVTALSTTVFVTALCTAVAATAMMLLNAHGLVGLPADIPVPVSASVQIALAFLAVGPLTVAWAINERRHVLDAVRYAGTRDDLTGALRRDEFYRLARRSLAGLRAGTAGVAVFAIDLDHFKTVNDTLGHRGGDEALHDFADRVRGQLRPADLFGRLGGEEFAVFLPDIDLESAYRVAERLRASQQRGAAESLGECGPTISTGLAFAAEPHVDLGRLIDIADAALYRAKHSRNATVVDSITEP
jgi:diguanylate cyclase (GGDEF)-like protein